MNSGRRMVEGAALALGSVLLLAGAARAVAQNDLQAAEKAAQIMQQNNITLARAIQIAEEHCRGKALSAEVRLTPMSGARGMGGAGGMSGMSTMSGMGGMTGGMAGTSGQSGPTGSSAPQGQPAGPTGQPGSPQSGQPAETSAQPSTQPSPASGQPTAPSGHTGAPAQAQWASQTGNLQFAVTCLVDNKDLQIVTVDGITGRVEGMRGTRMFGMALWPEERYAAEAEGLPRETYGGMGYERYERGMGYGRPEYAYERAEPLYDRWGRPHDRYAYERCLRDRYLEPYWRYGAYESRWGAPWELPTQRVTHIIGATVRNYDNEDLGRIEDLALDPERGRVMYAVLTYSGSPGMANKLFAVPWSALWVYGRDRVRLDVSRRELANAPGFDKDHWPNMTNPRWAEDVDGYYRQVSDIEQQPPAREIRKATDVIGSRVRNDRDQDLGRIENLVVDPITGRVAYGIVDFGGFLGMGDKLFAVPWDAFSHRDENTLVLHIGKERLREAEGFDRSNWPDLGDADWALRIQEFYGVRPYWLSSGRELARWRGFEGPTERPRQWEEEGY